MSTYNISICYWCMFDSVHILVWTLYSSYVCTAWNYVRDNILPQTIAAIILMLSRLVYVNEQIVACKYILAMIIVM